eukprot:6301809-Prymnesium_polylepis.1
MSDAVDGCSAARCRSTIVRQKPKRHLLFCATAVGEIRPPCAPSASRRLGCGTSRRRRPHRFFQCHYCVTRPAIST